MDKLQKAFKGIWRYKERIVLVVLLGFLAYRVVELFSPAEANTVIAEERGDAKPAEIAPNPPPPDAPGQYSTIVRRSPFSYYSDAKVDPSGVTPEEVGLELLDIKPVGDKLRVRLRTPGAKHGKWYDEGENFEEFILESVNVEEGTATVYVERIAKTITLRLR